MHMRIHLLLLTAAIISLTACGGGGSGGQASPFPTPVVRFIYASNAASNSVLLFSGKSNGNAAPAKVLAGSNTQLDTPAGLATNALGTLYVVNSPLGAGGSITIYPAFTGGNALPLSYIRGALTQLQGPSMIALDASGNMFVTNNSARNGVGIDSITAFSASAYANVYPSEWISGPATGLSQPNGIALDANGRIWVANTGNDSVTAYPQINTATSPANVAPLLTLSGAATGLNAPFGLAIDSSGRIWVGNRGSNTIEIFSANASGNQAPLFTLAGSATQLNLPQEIRFDSFGQLDVANLDTGSGSIEVFTPLPFPLPGSGNIAPGLDITGAGTQLNAPIGVAAQ